MSLNLDKIEFDELIESLDFSVQYDVSSALLEEGLKKKD